jgi:serine protease AprX
MRLTTSSTEGVRSSALWGKRSSGQRSSALWGKGGRGFVALLALATAMLVPASGFADSGSSSNSGSGGHSAVVPAGLLADAQAHPEKSFQVIVQGTREESSGRVAEKVKNNGGSLKRQFRSIAGVSATLSGRELVRLARDSKVLAITPDAPVKAADYQDAEMWRQSTHVDSLWSGGFNALTGLQLAAPQAPAIAIVDSGVDGSKLDSFGTRLLASVNLSSLSPGASGDDQGHGTMVAGIAAGADPLIPGAAQNAPLVSIRTSDANGQSRTGDVIAAADWILAHAKQYNIRVANFSLAGTTEVSFRFDPLDKAVERLWFDGVVVVAAAGNHGRADGAVSMSHAPANDPFVITVGAVDQNGSGDPADDSVAPWSGHGTTMDGFHKPDVSAPGRYMIMPVPENATIPASLPDRVLAPGYMWMSGTSFSAPVVSGAAAQILARHPLWGPDQVKGALMVTAAYLGDFRGGVGEIDASAAASLKAAPNPNENLNAYVARDLVTGAKSFNQASWASYVETLVANGASWASASWASASWASASWASASWASASWASASWASSVDSMMTATATQNEASWSMSTRVE